MIRSNHVAHLILLNLTNNFSMTASRSVQRVVHDHAIALGIG